MSRLQPAIVTRALSVEEIIRRSKAEFGFVQCDSNRGIRYAAERLAKTSEGLSHDEKDEAMAMLADTVEMILGDDRRRERHFLKCFVIPQGPVEIEYLYPSHASETNSLLERLAVALRYDIHE